MTTSETKPRDFMSTGQIEPMRGGVNRPAAGSNAGRTASETLPADTGSKVAAWLANQAPAGADAALDSLAQRHGVEWKVHRKITFCREGPNGEQLAPPPAPIARIEVSGHEAGIEETLRQARKFLTPAPDHVIEGWLAELSVIVAKREDDDLTAELRLRAYVNRLRDFPADAVRYVLLTKTWKFWPTWEELAQELNAVVEQRRAVIWALERRLSGGAETGGVPPMHRISEDERRTVGRGMASLGEHLRKALAEEEASL